MDITKLLSLLLGTVAGLLHIAAYALYNKQIFEKTSEPNLATWGTWVFLTILNAFSYKVMSGDLVKCILPIIGSLACLATFVYAFRKGKFSKNDFWDSIALGIGMFAAVVWGYYKYFRADAHAATYANIIMQFALATSFIPTYRGVWKNPKKEKALPWYIWGCAYALVTVVVILRWENNPWDLAYPVSACIFHTAVGLLTKRKVTQV